MIILPVILPMFNNLLSNVPSLVSKRKRKGLKLPNFFLSSKAKMFEKYYKNIRVCEELIDEDRKYVMERLSMAVKFPYAKFDIPNRSYSEVLAHLENAELHLIDAEALKHIQSLSEPNPNDKILSAGFDAMTCYAAMSSGIYERNLARWKAHAKKEFLARLKTDATFKENCIKYYS